MRQSRRHFIHKTKNWREASGQMTEMSDRTLLDVFKTIKSEEDSTNCFSVAAAKRKSLALNYYGSLQLKESPDAMEFLIGEDLDEYAELVDNTEEGKVNNYADSIFSIFSNFQNDERHSWKSHLSSFNLKNHIKSLSCSDTINCKNSVEPFYDSQILKQAFSKYKEIKEPEESGEKTRLFKRSYCSESNVSAIKNVAAPDESGDKARFFKKSFCSENNVSAAKNVTAEEDVSKNKTSLSFRTARDELQLQSYKKFGKISNANPRDKQNQGQLKKTLGARKGGVFGKFQPPLRSNENMEDEPKVDTDKAVDEKLKNIDPAMIELIKNEIMDSGPTLSWNDIAGLNLAKSIIQEIVVWPMLRPDIFTGLRRPPKGILLFGPPGTGKTLIGKCVASQSNSTFFSISASSLTSKWVGDGEKMVRTLFAVAKVYQPSVVFIDEIDSLLTQRSDSDHECSRRIKTEFLVQLDGAGTGDEDRILIIGATNRPQELDEAARRRLVKRLYIPLPDEEARKQIIENLISTERHCLTESEIENLAKMTNGYSGADVKNLCQEASLGPIRSVPPTMIQTINPEDVRPLNFKDFESALRRIKSSVSEGDLDVYLKWDKQYGCGSGFN